MMISGSTRTPSTARDRARRSRLRVATAAAAAVSVTLLAAVASPAAAKTPVEPVPVEPVPVETTLDPVPTTTPTVEARPGEVGVIIFNKDVVTPGTVPPNNTLPPITVSPPTYPPSNPFTVVTLGDSYTSGTGIWRRGNQYDVEWGGQHSSGLLLTGRSEKDCWRELQTTPGPKLASARGGNSIFYACKGAEASHVSNQITAMQMDNPNKAASGWSNSVIVASLGGNDIRTVRGDSWPKLLERCILEANPFGGCQDVSNNQISNWGAVQSSVQATVLQLANAAPNAKIRIFGYPRLMGPTKNWLGIWNCPDVTGVTGNEARWIDSQAATLNTIIANAVNAVRAAKPGVNLSYVDVTGHLPVGSCYGQGPAAHINDRVGEPFWTSDASFHPTQNGYNGYYNALLGSGV